MAKRSLLSTMQRIWEGAGENPVLADMDIVNAYFRSRLMKEKLAESGVLVISNNMEEYYNDTPALSAALYSCFMQTWSKEAFWMWAETRRSNDSIPFAHLLKDKEYDMWITVNANRMQTATLKQNLLYRRY